MPRRNKRKDAWDIVVPPPERGNHDPVDRTTVITTDREGRSSRSRPFQVIDLLDRMLDRGGITRGMHQAGAKFRSYFAFAQLDPLRCADLSKPMVDGGRRSAELGVRVENARNEVWRATIAIGGLASPGGSCVWHVVGWERPLNEWASGRGWCNKPVEIHEASGILKTALAVLQKHFGIEDKDV